MIFDVENWLWKSIFALCDKLAKPGKASQDAYNPGKWLILYALMKNWVAEGIASDVNYFNTEFLYTPCIDTITDFLINFCIKPRKCLLKISIFSLYDVIVRPTKIMNNLLKHCKVLTFKVLFQHHKSTESFCIFFSMKNIRLGD